MLENIFVVNLLIISVLPPPRKSRSIFRLSISVYSGQRYKKVLNFSHFLRVYFIKITFRSRGVEGERVRFFGSEPLRLAYFWR